jgi:hypothetical protein
MDEDDIGKVTRPQENTSVNDFTYLPVEHMDPQNYEGKRIGQV